jgi:hypothetical protein
MVKRDITPTNAPIRALVLISPLQLHLPLPVEPTLFLLLSIRTTPVGESIMWLVMLESTKDRVLGVDTSGQQVPPCVLYRTACLLIRDAMRSVPYSNEWEFDIVTHPGSHGARGVIVP